MVDLEALDRRFAIPGQIRFRTGLGGLPIAEINNEHATAAITPQGATVLRYRPRGHQPVLWLSRHSYFAQNRLIRGGIHVGWPWYAFHPTDPGKPAHGFARTALWEVESTGAETDGSTWIQLGLSNTPETQNLWPLPFHLRLVVRVGPELRVKLTAHNLSDQAFVCSGSLYSYFAVVDATAIAIHGLEGCAYIDQLDGQQKIQEGPVKIQGETNRIYLDTTAECAIIMPNMGRRIRIAKEGSRTTVVWNPGVAKAALLEDFGDHEHPNMVSVEPANAPPDLISIPPGGEHCLCAVIRVEWL